MALKSTKVEALLKQAGRLLLDASSSPLKIKQKGISDFVTEIDLAVEHLLENELVRIIPGSNVITEEKKKNVYDFSVPCWILDPVDGTTNLIRDLKTSCISLALVVEGTVIESYIYNPYLNEMYTAEAGCGAYLNGEKIAVGGNRKPLDCLVSFGSSPYDKPLFESVFDVVKEFYGKCLDIRRMGSAAIDLANIAAGRTDIYFEADLKPWDFAAGLLLVKEAGGTVTTWKDEALRLDRVQSILATNGLIHDFALSILKDTLI